jgi:hypothetical protein
MFDLLQKFCTVVGEPMPESLWSLLEWERHWELSIPADYRDLILTWGPGCFGSQHRLRIMSMDPTDLVMGQGFFYNESEPDAVEVREMLAEDGTNLYGLGGDLLPWGIWENLAFVWVVSHGQCESTGVFPLTYSGQRRVYPASMTDLIRMIFGSRLEPEWYQSLGDQIFEFFPRCVS